MYNPTPAKLNKADLWFQKAFAAHNAGDFEGAEALYRKVLKKTPSDHEAWYLLGTACSQLGKLDDAAQYLKKALELKNNYPEALNSLGLTLRKQFKDQEALGCFRRALEMWPDYADAHSNISSVLEKLGQLDEAERHVRLALELNANIPDAHFNLGMIMKARDRYEEAEQCFLRCLVLNPDLAVSHDGLAQVYKLLGRFDDAMKAVEKALALTPDIHAMHVTRGAILEEKGRYDEALEEYECATRLCPADWTAKWNQAYLFLRQGILDRGWELHELRFTDTLVGLRYKIYPQWDGSSLEDKTILIYAEQGLGDEILFSSCYGEIISRAKHCIIECDPRLEPLFARSFPTATVVGNSRLEVGWLAHAPKIDVCIPQGSLPRFYRPTLESFPKERAYLVADPQRVEFWRSRLTLLGSGLKVGICWRSGLKKGERHRFYSELTQWGDIFRVSGAHFVNLQYGECTEELREAEALFGVPITVFPDIDLRNQIDESAALMAGLDLVITASTAVSEISGAVGVEQFRINHYGKQWDCLGSTDRMPWHPSIRLFDQHTPGDWEAQLAEVAEELQEWVASVASDVSFIQLASNVQLAVNGSLEDLPTYVLKEQQGWFEPAYEFALKCVQSGRCMDVGAGMGVYAIPMAKNAADSRVWAYSQAADVKFLLKSRTHNELEKRVIVSVMDKSFSLDAELDKHGLDDIAFVRLAPEVSQLGMLAAGERFFSVNSPLLMFGIQPGAAFDTGMTEGLAAHGYDVYKLVPGLCLLVPWVSVDELDAFASHLFACKPDRAAYLEQRGLLAQRAQPLTRLPGSDCNDWQKYLGTMPYAANRLDEWIRFPQKPKDWEVYWMALNLFAMAKATQRAPSERYACLQQALGVMNVLVQGQATLPRLLSFCRMLGDLGKREASINLLNQVCGLLDSQLPRLLDEPALVLSERFALQNPGDKVGDWIVAMLLEQRELGRAFSTYFTGQEALPVLEEIQATGFGGEEIERRVELIKSRYALK